MPAICKEKAQSRRLPPFSDSHCAAPGGWCFPRAELPLAPATVRALYRAPPAARASFKQIRVRRPGRKPERTLRALHKNGCFSVNPCRERIKYSGSVACDTHPIQTSPIHGCSGHCSMGARRRAVGFRRLAVTRSSRRRRSCCIRMNRTTSPRRPLDRASTHDTAKISQAAHEEMSRPRHRFDNPPRVPP